MSSTAASGFVFLLLSVQVIQSQHGWRVTYTSTAVCNVIGSRVVISCRYTYPSTIRDHDIRKTFWFTKEKNGQPVEIMSDSQYTGRVKNECYDQRCTLIISDLRKSDGARYKFRFTTNNNAYTGSPGVTLAVTDPGLKVKVSKLDSTRVRLECLSSYVLPIRPSYIWYMNEEKIETRSYFVPVSFGSSNSYSCAVQGQKNICSPPVYPPKLPSVSVSPSKIVEGNSVTLTCSSDANPAASYTWYKLDEDLPKASGRIFIITDFTDEHSGKYSCEAQNTIGLSHSTFHLSLSADNKTMILQSIYWILAVLVLSSLILFFLWLRKKKAVISTTEPDEYAEAFELDVYHAYENISDNAAQPEDTEEFQDYTLLIYDKLLKIASD